MHHHYSDLKETFNALIMPANFSTLALTVLFDDINITVCQLHSTKLHRGRGVAAIFLQCRAQITVIKGPDYVF